MEFNTETYLDSLSKDIEWIDVSRRNLTFLHCLSRFKNLRRLNCSDNRLTSLPPLPENLKELFCYHNKLCSLPPLPENLSRLSCYDNKLTSLPPLPEKLEELVCYHNKLTSLPPLPEKLEYLCCFNNPISEIINGNNTSEIKKQIQILNNFRHLHYSLKFKKQFRHLLWVKIREPKIMKKYHPDYLIENLHEDTDLDAFLDNWL